MSKNLHVKPRNKRMFQKLKNKYNGKIVSKKVHDEIEETEGVLVEDNGYSGRGGEYEGCYWFSACELSEDCEKTDVEFDFYCNSNEFN